MIGRKIPVKFEHPLDHLFISLSETLNPFFYALGFNPNGITTLSLVTGLASCYLFHTNKFIFAGILFLVSYFFDCMDGNFARTYKMQTKFGDIYDHIKDILVNILFLYIFYTKKIIPPNIKIAIFVTVVALFLGMLWHLGCTEKYLIRDKKHNPSNFLNVFTNICKDSDENFEKGKWFGCATFNLFLASVTFLHYFYSKK